MSTHQGTRENHGQLFQQRLPQIERLIHATAVRKRLSAEEREELYSLVMLKIIENDYAVLRGFQGKSRWRTYLAVVIERVLLDHRTQKWGRWRPCAVAQRLGSAAVDLDRRINRDGLEPSEAIRERLVRGGGESAAEIERLVALIPRRPRRSFVPAEKVTETLAAREEADQHVASAERQGTASYLDSVLGEILRDLPDDERDLLDQRFAQGLTVRRIAAEGNLQERSLYRRFETILRRLRRHLKQLGLGWREISDVLDGHEARLEIGLR